MAAAVVLAQLVGQVLLAVQGHRDKVTLAVMLMVLHLTHQAVAAVRGRLVVVHQAALADQVELALHIQFQAHL